MLKNYETFKNEVDMYSRLIADKMRVAEKMNFAIFYRRMMNDTVKLWKRVNKLFKRYPDYAERYYSEKRGRAV